MPMFRPLAVLDCLYWKTFWRLEQFVIPYAVLEPTTPVSRFMSMAKVVDRRLFI